jgi:hypothetical protein
MWCVYSIAESWGASAPDKPQCQPLKHGHTEILPDDEKVSGCDEAEAGSGNRVSGIHLNGMDVDAKHESV